MGASRACREMNTLVALRGCSTQRPSGKWHTTHSVVGEKQREHATVTTVQLLRNILGVLPRPAQDIVALRRNTQMAYECVCVCVRVYARVYAHVRVLKQSGTATGSPMVGRHPPPHASYPYTRPLSTWPASPGNVCPRPARTQTRARRMSHIRYCIHRLPCGQ